MHASLCMMSQNIYDYVYYTHPSDLEMKLVGLAVIFSFVQVGYNTKHVFELPIRVPTVIMIVL